MKTLKTGTYYGTKKADTNHNGVILSEYDYKASRTDWHFHENPYFMYVIEGNLFDVNKQSKKHCNSGSLIFHNWEEAHYNTRETNHARGFHIEFPRQWFATKKLNDELWEGSRLINHPQAHLFLAKIYFEFRFQDEYSNLSTELLLLQLCENIEFVEFATKHQPSWIAQLHEILQEEDENLSLKSLSQQLGVHPVHISRAIPKYFGSSLGDYLRQQKIKKALHYLPCKDYSLTDIAHLCKFSDQSHFTRTFKTYLQKTPLEFRKQLF